MSDLASATDITAAVRERYATAARSVLDADSCCVSAPNDLASALYDADERALLPADAVNAALGCANPSALAALAAGETVLDLGSGGGIDVLLSARRVGPTGFVYGLDMTEEMLELAERNRAQAGAENVQFLRGRIEDIPLPDNTVDVILSNCVINLSPDKDRVFAEAFRVLRAGGRLAITDIATLEPLPATVRASLDAWTGCIAGALSVEQIHGMLIAIGFTGVLIETVRTYGRADLAVLDSSALGSLGLDTLPDEDLTAAEGKLASVFIRANKAAR